MKKLFLTSTALVLTPFVLNVNSTIVSKTKSDEISQSISSFNSSISSQNSTTNKSSNNDDSTSKLKQSKELNNDDKTNQDFFEPDKSSLNESQSSFDKALNIYAKHGNKIFSNDFSKDQTVTEASKAEKQKYNTAKEFKTGLDKVEFWGFGVNVWITKSTASNVASALGITSVFSSVIGVILLLLFIAHATAMPFFKAMTGAKALYVLGTAAKTSWSALSASAIASKSGVIATGVSGFSVASFIGFILSVVAIVVGILFVLAIAKIASHVINAEIGTYFSLDFGVVSTPITALATLRNQKGHEITPQIKEKDNDIFYPEGRQTINIKADNDKSGFIVSDWRNLQNKFVNDTFSGVIDISKFTTDFKNSDRKIKYSLPTFYFAYNTKNIIKLDVNFRKFIFDYLSGKNFTHDYLFFVLNKKHETLKIGGFSRTSDDDYEPEWETQEKFNFEDQIDWNKIDAFGFKLDIRIN